MFYSFILFFHFLYLFFILFIFFLYFYLSFYSSFWFFFNFAFYIFSLTFYLYNYPIFIFYSLKIDSRASVFLALCLPFHSLLFFTFLFFCSNLNFSLILKSSYSHAFSSFPFLLFRHFSPIFSCFFIQILSSSSFFSLFLLSSISFLFW